MISIIALAVQQARGQWLLQVACLLFLLVALIERGLPPASPEGVLADHHHSAAQADRRLNESRITRLQSHCAACSASRSWQIAKST